MAGFNNKKAVNQYDLNGKFIKKWESAKNAARELDINFSGISSCCNNNLKTYKFYIWRFA